MYQRGLTRPQELTPDFLRSPADLAEQLRAVQLDQPEQLGVELVDLSVEPADLGELLARDLVRRSDVEGVRRGNGDLQSRPG
jgi:hypothetical protein